MTTLYYTPGSQDLEDAVVVRVYTPPRYRTGGLHRHAEMVRQGGRGDDEVLLHITPDEFKQLKSAWGEPGINPNTGLPEYGFLHKIGKGLKNVGNKIGNVAKKVVESPIVQKLGPIAASIFLPGVGGIIASAALKGVNAKLQGGNFGDVLKSGAMGALGAGVGRMIPGLGGGDKGVLSNVAKFMPGEARNAAQVMQNGSIGAEGVGADQGQGQGGILGKLKGFFTNDQGNPAWGKIAGTALGGLALLKGMQGSQKPTAPPPLPASFSQGLPQMNFNRVQNPLGNRDLLHYAESPEGEFNFFQPPTYTPRAGGGGVRGPGSGRDDKIDALLSDGEYVMDAETVSMLGDGSLDEGARRLDQMRENIRKHKGRALAKGKFSPDAKSPEQYLGKAEGGPVADNPQLGVTDLPPVNSNQPAPLPNPGGQYAGDQGQQQMMNPDTSQAMQALEQLSKTLALRDLKKKVGSSFTQAEMQGYMDAMPKAKGGYVDSLEFWNKEGARIGKQLTAGNYDGPAELASLKRNKAIISTKIAAKKRGYAKGGKINESTLRGIIGGVPKPSPAEGAAQLDAIQRMIQAYKQAQDAAAQEKARLGITEGTDPYNQPPKVPLKVVEARGGLIDAQKRVSLIQNKVKRAAGGPVQALDSFADDLEEALNSGNKDRVAQLHQELGTYTPTIPKLYAKGGPIKPEQVLGILEKSRVPPAGWNPDSLRAVAEELRRLNPNSEVLRQYDMAAKRKPIAPPPQVPLIPQAAGDTQ